MAIESISRRSYSGEVRNLTVDADESYIANGAVVHNCTCRVSAMKPSWRNAMAKLGYLQSQPTDGDKKQVAL